MFIIIIFKDNNQSLPMSKASVFDNASPDESPFPKLKPVGKKSITSSDAGDGKAKDMDSRKGSTTLKSGMFGESKTSKPPTQMKKPTESPASGLLPGGKQVPSSPLTPAPVRRIIPELKGAREETDVLPPEERLKMHRESIANMTEAPQRIVPQLKGENDDPDILPPEERRRLASIRMAESSGGGERVIPKLVSDKDDLSILPPEERRRLAREQAQIQDTRSRQGSMISQVSKHSSVGVPSAASKHSSKAGTPIPTPVQMPLRSPAMSVKSPLEPRTPLFSSGPTECENCATRQHRIDDLEGRNYNLEREVQTSEEKIASLTKKVTAEKESAAKDKKKSKDELARKDKKIKTLEQDLRDAQRHAARRGSESSAGGQMAELLSHRDATIAELQRQIDAQQLQIDSMDTVDDSQALSEVGSVEDEVATLNSQIWALETACEFRMREITRLNENMQDFVSRVEKLDKELAEAMRQILEKGHSTQREEEQAVFGGPIEDVVTDFKQKRAETKTKKRRRPRKGALSRENAELRDELASLREEMSTMRTAMASKNPQLFVQSMARLGGTAGGHVAGASQKNCCFTAAFIAAGQAEAQIETLKGHYKSEQDRCSQLESMLDKARSAIVSSAGVGYENEIKLQQAKRALQCIIDTPEDPQKSIAAVPTGAAALVNMPSTVQIAHMASNHSSVFERREKSNCIHVRSISPVRNAAWITAPPRPSTAIWETRIG